MSAGVLAVDVGGTSTKVALVTRPGAIHHWRSFPTRPPLVGYRARLAQEVLQVAELAGREVLGTACAIAGFVDGKGTLLYNGNLPWLQEQSFADALRLSADWPVVVESDSNAACAGEALFGVGKGVQRMLCLTIGTGVGAGMMVDGALVRTAYGCLGDAGHVIVAPEGPACTCGGRGCAEAVLSTVRLGERYGADFRKLAGDAEAGEERALALTEEAGTALGIAIASIANIFAPECIAVAGGLAHLGQPLLIAADASFRRHAGSFIHQGTRLLLARTGSQATLLGAAACFFTQTETTSAKEP